MSVERVTPFLWFEKEAETAVDFYVGLLPDSRVVSVDENESGQPFIIEFELAGHPYAAMNAGPHYRLTEAFSIAVSVDTQEDIDRLWKALSAGGTEMQCGWLTNRFGVTWQIVPTQFDALRRAGTPQQTQSVTEAMLKMVKFDIAALEEAFENAG